MISNGTPLMLARGTPAKRQSPSGLIDCVRLYSYAFLPASVKGGPPVLRKKSRISAPCQKPERSGLPSGIVGVGFGGAGFEGTGFGPAAGVWPKETNAASVSTKVMNLTALFCHLRGMFGDPRSPVGRRHQPAERRRDQ